MNCKRPQHFLLAPNLFFQLYLCGLQFSNGSQEARHKARLRGLLQLCKYLLLISQELQTLCVLPVETQQKGVMNLLVPFGLLPIVLERAAVGVASTPREV